MDLARIGLELRETLDGPVLDDPRHLSHTDQTLDLWSGTITSRFRFADEDVEVLTVADPDTATVAFQIRSELLVDGRARIAIRFPYPSDGFFQTDDWAADPARHSSALRLARTTPGTASK